MFCLWEQGANQLHQRSKLLHPAWQWAGRKIQCRKVFLVLSLCYNRHFIQSWLKLERASSGGWKHNCCADCFVSNGVWCMDTQGALDRTCPFSSSQHQQQRILTKSSPTKCIRILQIYYSTGNHFCITDNYWCKNKKTKNKTVPYYRWDGQL